MGALRLLIFLPNGGRENSSAVFFVLTPASLTGLIEETYERTHLWTQRSLRDPARRAAAGLLSSGCRGCAGKGPPEWNARDGPAAQDPGRTRAARSEEHTSELQSPDHLVCRLLLEKKKKIDSVVSNVSAPGSGPSRVAVVGRKGRSRGLQTAARAPLPDMPLKAIIPDFRLGSAACH